MPFFRRTRHPTTAQSPQDEVYTPVGPEGSFFVRLLSHRAMELIGLFLLVIALCISISLFSFNPNDPSFNTATGTPPTNLLGHAGATIAEALIQWLGLGSTLPVIILLAWTWRLMRYHSISAPFLRLIAAFLLLPASAFLVDTSAQLILPGVDITWPSDNGPGGEVGTELARYTLNAMHGMMGTTGELTTLFISFLLIALLTPLALGLTGNEWRAIGSGFWYLLRWPFIIINRKMQNTQPLPSTEQASYIFTPQYQNIPTRPSTAIMANNTARPSGFLRYRTMQQAAHTSQTATAQSWITPPQHTTETRAEESSPSPMAMPQPSAPSEQPYIEEDIPSNRYGEKLAQIHRDKEHTAPPHTPPPLDVESTDTDKDTKEPVIPLQTQKKSNFLKRITGRGSPKVSNLDSEMPGPHSGKEEPEEAKTSKTTFQGWQPPSFSLLSPPPGHHLAGPSEESLNAHARLLESVLNDYGVQGTIQDYHAGPVVTLYELEPAPGVRSSRVIGLSDDIARSLSVLSVRIATVPGRNVIGIEVPNTTRETVYFSELLHTEEWQSGKGKLQLALGKNIAGTPVYADLAKMPHLLVAGTTGSGKSVGINAMILSLLYRLSPEDCRLIMIDPKILELSIYDGIPHLMTPVVTEPSKAVSALKWTVQEMDRRYRLIADHQVRNISSYNERIRHLRASGETPTRRIQTGYDPETGHPVFDEHRLPLEHLPYIVVVIDEMADLMMVAGKEIEAAVLRLAQKARAAGIHVIMATQRPSVDVITGTIKANFPTRISFQVTNKYDSRTILGEQGAEQLLGRGDMLFMQGGARITRVHGPFISDEEVEAVVASLRSKGQPVYNADVIADEEETSQPGRSNTRSSDQDGHNDLYEQAVALVLREKRASTSFVQRHLSIGYNRAANIIDQMEREGIISAANHVGKREILASCTPDNTDNA